MKNKKVFLKTNQKTVDQKTTRKKEKPVFARRINDIDKLFTKKDIKNIVDSIVNQA